LLTELLNLSCKGEITGTAEREGYTMTYVLTETTAQGDFGSFFSITVSIRKNGYFDTASAYDITRIRNKALDLFHLLMENAVTPCTLTDVLTDLL